MSRHDVFDDRGPVEKCHFLRLSKVCIFGIQIREVLDFRVPDVKMIFILIGSPQIEKIEVFDDRGPVEKCLFFYTCFHNFAYLGSKSVNFWILGVLMSQSRHDDVLHFNGLSRK